MLQPIAEGGAFLALPDFQKLFHIKLLRCGREIKGRKPSDTQNSVERLFPDLRRKTESKKVEFFPEQWQVIINCTRQGLIVLHVLYATIQRARPKESRFHNLASFLLCKRAAFQHGLGHKIRVIK